MPSKKSSWVFTGILAVGLLLIALAPLPARFCSPPQPCATGPAFPSTTFPLFFSIGVALLIVAAIFYFSKRKE